MKMIERAVVEARVAEIGRYRQLFLVIWAVASSAAFSVTATLAVVLPPDDRQIPAIVGALITLCCVHLGAYTYSYLRDSEEEALLRGQLTFRLGPTVLTN